ncbi:amino acid adenylation domain-containing protein [Salmonella enterica subsp. enterica serovar Infantis]|uniref:Amino acid adenylation domain-containing protein n=2 Tax=Salmonella enterica TaxID=28901 RepID=A0A750IRK0_SALER|nr:amino acid adenylation domain-containing protein [Salmonella enterica subsp. enterica serovar Oranienburg]EHA8878913.1 amino acid adenylation domain-containing protein [Salmonella enterica subsp. enterica serovar Infantis]HAF6298291.1 amino acid adenylation domain-containing protein [Salmonella enterica]HCA3587603.1 amino acid adenylation domain-containing protein [Salmonella enterica subsp. enterica serovar Java]EDV9209312.1 amino acid adenylation domain-containing protein [Salmonella enter
MTTPIDIEQIIEELFRTCTHVTLSAVADDDNLIALGIDSLSMMRISGRLRKQGLPVSFAQLISAPQLSSWRKLISSQQQVVPAPVITPAIHPDNAPFDLALMQHAYWIGRRPDQPMGGVNAHFYHEFDGKALDPARLEQAVRHLMIRHPMLRVHVDEEGQQRIEDLNWPGIVCLDLRTTDEIERQRILAARREQFSCRRMNVSNGEVFDVQLTLLPNNRSRLHMNLDMIAADAMSLRILLDDLANIYHAREKALLSLNWRFADYLHARKQQVAQNPPLAARDYWQKRLPLLPESPQLPIHITVGMDNSSVSRRHYIFSREARLAFDRQARLHGLTPAMVFAAAYAEVLTAWSAAPDFLLNMPLFNRQPLHNQVDMLVGDFTSSILLAWEGGGAGSFVERAHRLQKRFHQDVTAAEYSGVEVLRDLSRDRGHPVYAPVVFTSALGLGELFSETVRDTFGEPVWIVSQGPQVWLDVQLTEFNGGYMLNWDAREAAFPAGMLDAMFDACIRYLTDLVAGKLWDKPVPAMLSATSEAVRQHVNDTGRKIIQQPLHHAFFRQSIIQSQAPALLYHQHIVTYGELAERALKLAALLIESGVRHGEPVAITLAKGPKQIIAVLAVLAAGAVWLPVGVHQPIARRDRIMRSGCVRWAIAEKSFEDNHDVTVIYPDEADSFLPITPCVIQSPGDLAYIIYTSGSTGEPKGVEITHGAAHNTIADINHRSGICADDRLLAVSALDFDLSVYDIFGPLSVGAALVLIDEDERRDAVCWLENIQQHHITFWNSVPVLLEMLLAARTNTTLLPLRCVMLSGDWIPLELPARLRSVAPTSRLLAMGGATEAAIWSNLFEVEEVDAGWRSIPYGRPLTNQRYRVVDILGRDCPDWVAGELWIGGQGVALGYRQDEEKTAARFVYAQGERWYRTGDAGRYWPDGILEFLGRIDHQVKIRGHRIELGEVEAAIKQLPGIQQSVALVSQSGKLLAVAVGEPLTQGEWKDALARLLAREMLPEQILWLDTLPLSSNGKVDRKVLLQWAEERLKPQHTNESGHFSVHQTHIADVWRKVLSLETLNMQDNFFNLGGDSLQATRVISELRRTGFKDASLALLFASPQFDAFCSGLTKLTGNVADVQIWQAAPEDRYAPFVMTDIQQAYCIGRRPQFTLGGIGCHFYREYTLEDLNHERLEQALNQLIGRHDMLRAVFEDDNQQRVLAEVPWLKIPVLAEGTGAFSILRTCCSHQVFDPRQWPLLNLSLAQENGVWRLAIGIDNLVADALSVMIIYDELNALYHHPERGLPPLTATFRDYLHNRNINDDARKRSWQWWQDIMPTLPSHPHIPLAVDPSTLKEVKFTRRHQTLDNAVWQLLVAQCQQHGYTPSALLLAAFSYTLGRWCENQTFTLNLTLFDREDLHEDIPRLVGDFTSLVLVPWFPEAQESWHASVKRTQQALWQAIEHKEVSGISVLRELARINHQPDMIMPVVFTSALGLNVEASSEYNLFDNFCWGISQTPQVWLDFQVTGNDNEVTLTWDAVEELFPSGMLDDMFEAFCQLLTDLPRYDGEKPLKDMLPVMQQRCCKQVNVTPATIAPVQLHDAFFCQASEKPERTALWWQGKSISYGKLAQQARQVAAMLLAHNVRPQDLVAIAIPDGPDQVIAVLGVLAAGACWVWIDRDQPVAQQDAMNRNLNVRWLLMDNARLQNINSELQMLHIEDATDYVPLSDFVSTESKHPACILLTVGTDGTQKGMEISHGAIVSTLHGVDQYAGITPNDCLLALASAGSALRLYDLFSTFSVGASLVLLTHKEQLDVENCWLQVQQHHVSLWNSDWSCLEKMLSAVPEGITLPSLRKVLVSGDKVPLLLFEKLHTVASNSSLLVLRESIGTAIWSNIFIVSDANYDGNVFPAGYPLGNQYCRVVDAFGRDCPDYVNGELWIAGINLAIGYRGDLHATSEAFVWYRGIRWYRTGERVYYQPDGILISAGRIKQNVLMHGRHIDTSEIEAELQSLPGIGNAWVTVIDEGERAHLVAAVSPCNITVSRSVSCDDVPVVLRDIEDYEFEAQGVERAMLAILQLTRRDGGQMLHCVTPIAAAWQPLISRWLDALQARQLVLQHQDGLLAGNRFDVVSTVLNECHPAMNNYQQTLTPVFKALHQQYDVYRAILQDKQSPLLLLEHPILSPESLLIKDNLFRELVMQWASSLNVHAASLARPLRVVELGGRSGQLAAFLLPLLSPDVCYTMLDTSPTLVNSAQQRLAGDTRFSAETCRNDWLPETLRYQFDVVLCANSLHRFDDHAQGVALACQLAVCGGRLWLVESSELTPLALMTAAVLERGYSRHDAQCTSPLLSMSEWCHLLQQAGLEVMRVQQLAGSTLFVLEGSRLEQTINPDSTQIRMQLSTKLPASMIPEWIEVVPQLSVNKKDEEKKCFLTRLFELPEHYRDGEEPQGETENAIADIWRELLSLEKINREQGFFELGGDSLMATRFLTRITQTLGVTLPMREMFITSQLYLLAQRIDQLLADQAQREEGAL